MDTDTSAMLSTGFLFFAFICENLCPSVDHKTYPELRSTDRLVGLPVAGQEPALLSIQFHIRPRCRVVKRFKVGKNADAGQALPDVAFNTL